MPLVVVDEGRRAGDQLPGTAVWPQPEIHPVGVLLAGVRAQILPQPGSERRGALPQAGPARVVHRRQIDVGAVVELAPPQLAERQDRHAIAELPVQIGADTLQRDNDHRVGGRCQLGGRHRDRSAEIEVAGSDAQQLPAPEQPDGAQPAFVVDSLRRQRPQVAQHRLQRTRPVQPALVGDPVQELRVPHQGIDQELAGREHRQQQAQPHRLLQHARQVRSWVGLHRHESLPVVERHVRIGAAGKIVERQHHQARQGAALLAVPGPGRIAHPRPMGDADDVAHRAPRVAEAGAAQERQLYVRRDPARSHGPGSDRCGSGRCGTDREHQVRRPDRVGAPGDGLVTEAAIHERPNCRGVHLEVGTELRRLAQTAVAAVADAPRQVRVFHAVGGRQQQVPRRAAQHAQAVDQAPQEVVGGGQHLRFRVLDHLQPAELIQRCVHARGSQGRCVRSVHDLQDLHRVLDVHQRPGAELGVGDAARALLAHLPRAQVCEGRHVERSARVQHAVPQPLDPRAQRPVAGHRAQPDERQALVRQRRPVDIVVGGERLQAAGERSGLAVGSQAGVHVEDPLALGRDQLLGVAHQPVIELAVRQLVGTGGAPLIAVHEQQLDVGCVAERTAAELAEREDGVVRLQARERARPAMAPAQVVERDGSRRGHDRLGKLGEAVAQLAKAEAVGQQVIEVEQEHLPVLEVVQRTLPRRDIRRCPRHRVGQPRRARAGPFGVPGGAGVAQPRQQRLVLQPHEVLPEVVAGAQQASQAAEHRGVAQQLRPPTSRRALQQLARQVAETPQRRERVRGTTKEVRELLGQQRRQLDARQVVRRRQGGAGGGGHDELIGDAPGLRGDHHLVDDHVQRRQRGCEGIEEERRVLRGDRQPGAPRLAALAGQHFRVHFDRVEKRLLVRVGGYRARHQLVHVLLGGVATVPLQQRKDRTQLRGRLLREPRGARRRHVTDEAIDHACAQRTAGCHRVGGACQGSAPRIDAAPPARRAAGSRVLLRAGMPRVARVGEGVALLDAEPEGAEHAGDQRELVPVVECDNRAGKPFEGGGFHGDVGRHVRPKMAGGPRMPNELGLGERAQVPFTEPRQMLVYELGVDLRAADDDPPAQCQRGTARAMTLRFLRFRNASSIPDCPQNVAGVRCRSRARTPTGADAGPSPGPRSPSCSRSTSRSRPR